MYCPTNDSVSSEIFPASIFEKIKVQNLNITSQINTSCFFKTEYQIFEKSLAKFIYCVLYVDFHSFISKSPPRVLTLSKKRIFFLHL